MYCLTKQFEHPGCPMIDVLRTYKKFIQPLILSLSRKASERKGVEAHSFLLSLSKWDFILTNELLAEVLPRLGTLSKTL